MSRDTLLELLRFLSSSMLQTMELLRDMFLGTLRMVLDISMSRVVVRRAPLKRYTVT